MPDETRFGDVPLIADTTAWCKLHLAPPEVQEDFRAAAVAGLIVGSPVVHLEFLHHQINGAAFDIADASYSAVPSLPLTPAISAAAVEAMRALRTKSAGGLHRVKAADALIAATAEAYQVNVLHDDKHYGTLAQVLGFTPVRFGPYH
jgi:predicted nucleic acid-binding protein